MKTPEEIEKLTNRALNSLDGMSAVEANPFLFEKIKHRLIQQRREAAAGHYRLMFRLSAVLLLFAGINVGSFYLLNQPTGPKPKMPLHVKKLTGIDALGQEYFPNTASYNY